MKRSRGLNDTTSSLLLLRYPEEVVVGGDVAARGAVTLNAFHLSGSRDKISCCSIAAYSVCWLGIKICHLTTQTWLQHNDISNKST